MSEQPASALFEAVRLVEVLRRRVSGATGSGSRSGDVWSEATSEAWGEHFATGAPECRYCPVCRAIAASRESGPDVVSHVVAAGESLFAAFRDAVAGFERTRPAEPQRHEPGGEPAGGDRPQGD
jgi:hypothetical protein